MEFVVATIAAWDGRGIRSGSDVILGIVFDMEVFGRINTMDLAHLSIPSYLPIAPDNVHEPVQVAHASQILTTATFASTQSCVLAPLTRPDGRACCCHKFLLHFLDTAVDTSPESATCVLSRNSGGGDPRPEVLWLGFSVTRPVGSQHVLVATSHLLHPMTMNDGPDLLQVCVKCNSVSV